MKKLVAAIIVLFTLCLCCVQVSAEERDYTEELLSVLPTLAEERIGDKLRDGEVASLVSVEYLAELVFDSFFDSVDGIAGDFCILLSLTLFFAVFTSLRENINEKMGKAAESILLALAALAVYRLFFDGVEMTFSYIEDAKSFTNSLIPITAGVYLMGGNTATAVSAGAGAGAALVCVENLCSLALPTLSRILFALALVGSVGGNVSYGAICREVRNAYMTALGFFTMILSASLSFGGSISSSADSVAARAVKYAIGNMLPIVGGTVNSAYGALSASVGVIKNTVGVSAIVALVVITLPVIIRLLLIRTSLNICTAVSEIIGCARIGKLYTDLRSVYDLVLSAAVFVSLVFVIICSVFLKCTVAIG